MFGDVERIKVSTWRVSNNKSLLLNHFQITKILLKIDFYTHTRVQNSCTEEAKGQ